MSDVRNDWIVILLARLARRLRAVQIRYRMYRSLMGLRPGAAILRSLFSVVAAVLISGCTVLPTAPTPASAPRSTTAYDVAPIDAGPPHDLAVVVEDALTVGQVAYVCSTEPREYCRPDGACNVEIDYYVQAARCPSQRIK